ncbi:MAG: hypothetical protein DI589_13735 [Shinella sp.]|jgi:predicted site-specific integrase-resolvase|nr:MAG: hypothetical protein DI589_13735 [Shinella sp.]
MTGDRYLQTKQIAEIFGCRTASVRRMFREGRLNGAFKVGGSRGRIRMADRDVERLTKSKQGGL